MSPAIRKPCPRCKVVLIAAPARACAGCLQAYEQRRGTAAQRGYDGRHARWRRMVLATYDTCVDCGAPGQVGDHADHVVSLASGGDWSVENGRRRCHRCHSKKTVMTDGGFGRPRGGQRPSRGDSGVGGQELQAAPSPLPRGAEVATDVAVALLREEPHGA